MRLRSPETRRRRLTSRPAITANRRTRRWRCSTRSSGRRTTRPGQPANAEWRGHDAQMMAQLADGDDLRAERSRYQPLAARAHSLGDCARGADVLLGAVLEMDSMMRPSRLYAHLKTHDWFAVTIDFSSSRFGVYAQSGSATSKRARAGSADRRWSPPSGRICAIRSPSNRHSTKARSCVRVIQGRSRARRNAAARLPAHFGFRLAAAGPCLGVLQLRSQS